MQPAAFITLDSSWSVPTKIKVCTLRSGSPVSPNLQHASCDGNVRLFPLARFHTFL